MAIGDSWRQTADARAVEDARKKEIEAQALSAARWAEELKKRESKRAIIARVMPPFIGLLRETIERAARAGLPEVDIFSLSFNDPHIGPGFLEDPVMRDALEAAFVGERLIFEYQVKFESYGGRGGNSDIGEYSCIKTYVVRPRTKLENVAPASKTEPPRGMLSKLWPFRYTMLGREHTPD